MTAEKDQLGFDLPERRKPGKDSFNTKQRKVEEWIALLPMGNVGETARQVFGALHETNRLRVSWQERYRLLESLRAPVAYVGQALHKRFLGLTFPLPPKTRRIAHLATELYNEMALGYKIAIEDMLDANFLFRDKRALTIMLHRALRYLNKVLLTTYQVYSPQPHNTWSDIHRLYRYAETARLFRASVTDTEQELLPKTTIATAYKQALLLALASPYRLRQGEVGIVYSALELWAHLAQIMPYDAQADREAALCYPPLDSHGEPSHLVFSHYDRGNGGCRLIDLQPLAITVREELGQAERSSTTELKRRLGAGLTVDLLRRLSLTWGVPPKRSSARNAKAEDVEVVVGLSSVHRALGLVTALRSMTALPNASNATAPEDLFSRTSTFQSRTIASENDQKADVWDPFKARAATQQSAQRPQAATAKATPLPLQTWAMRDQSAGGCRIARSGMDTLGVQVGDLIGVRPYTDTHDRHWTVSVVRWIRHTSEEELELGVQSITGRGQPAAARTRQPNGTMSEYQRIIGLPEDKEHNLVASLLVPPLLYTVGATLSVRFDETEHPLLLTGVQEGTGSFVQFTFENLNAIRNEPARENPQQPSDFNSLWSDL